MFIWLEKWIIVSINPRKRVNMTKDRNSVEYWKELARGLIILKLDIKLIVNNPNEIIKLIDDFDRKREKKMEVNND